MPVWVCCKCFKIKDLNGPHLDGKTEVRSDCWPCATKRRFRLAESSEALRTELEKETPKEPIVPTLEIKKAETMPKPSAPTGFKFSNSPRDNDPTQFQKLLGKADSSDTKPAEKTDVAPVASKPSISITAADPSQLEWRCAKCNKVKDLSGDHLKGKTSVRSDCWPCATKREFRLLARGQAEAPVQAIGNTPQPEAPKPVQAPLSSSTPAATEANPVFGASTENPFAKLIQKDEAKPTEKPNPFSKLVQEEEAKPKANPFSKLIEEQGEKPKANPFSLGSSTSTQTPENPFTKALQAQEAKPNPFSLKAEPASSATLVKTQEQSKKPVEVKVEPKLQTVESTEKAEAPRPNHADSSEPWRQASPTLNCHLEPIETTFTLPPDFDPFATGKGEKHAIGNPHFISTELAKSVQEAPRVERAAGQEIPRVAPQENLALAAKVKTLEDERKAREDKMHSMETKMRAMEKKMQKLHLRCELQQEQMDKLFAKHVGAVQEAETNMCGIVDQVDQLVALVNKLATR